MEKLSPHLLLKELPFSQDVLNQGGMLYVVGGSVRDYFVNKESKDLDILVTNISVFQLDEILHKYGKVDLVGASFGIIKFKEFGSTEDIDIAVPRMEEKVGGGHKGFKINADPFLPIGIDLSRRDFTMNAIAIDFNGLVHDPFCGISDILNKQIKIVNPQAFADDPLRMLRAIQFASRFNFTIEPETFGLIKVNTKKINEISGERILIELEKIVNKGDIKFGATLLMTSGLYKEIFKREFKYVYFSKLLSYVKSVAEFIFVLCNCEKDCERFFKEKLKGDIETTKTIKALYYLHSNYSSVVSNKTPIIFKGLQICKSVINSNIFNDTYTNFMFDEFRSGLYPKSYKELAINGDDLIEIGFEPGIQMGAILNDVMELVLTDKLENKKEKIIETINNTYR